MSLKDGGPAFPTEYFGEDDIRRTDRGMSLRDYFAAQALPWALDNNFHLEGANMRNEYVAAQSYRIADAMLAERAK